MKYLSTTLATDWPEKESWKVKLIGYILFFIPRANPGYDREMHKVKRWLVEFLEEEDGTLLPWREIGLSSNNEPVLAGPDKINYGFWLDTNMKYNDFDGEVIKKEEFERYWKISGVQELE